MIATSTIKAALDGMDAKHIPVRKVLTELLPKQSTSSSGLTATRTLQEVLSNAVTKQEIIKVAIGMAIATIMMQQLGIIATGTIEAVKHGMDVKHITVRKRAALIQISVKEIS